MSILIAGLFALAVWWVLPPPAEPRLHGLLGASEAESSESGPAPAVAWIATSTAAVAVVLLWPGFIGLVAAGACVALIPRAVSRMESRSARRRREDLARQGPSLVDLLAATLASGAPMRPALAAVSLAVDDPARSALAPVVAALDLGADAAAAWLPLRDDPVLSQVAAAVSRSERTGAPLSALLARLAGDLRRERRAVVEVAARSAGVRAVLPLAACFLPAFLLLGVVPVVSALASALLSS